MTDRINSLAVILDEDIRIDDAQPLIAAIMQLKGVVAVEPQVRSISADMVARSRIRLEMWEAIRKILWKDES